MNIDIEMENLYNIFIDVNTIYLIGVSELIFGVPTNFCVNINIDIDMDNLHYRLKIVLLPNLLSIFVLMLTILILMLSILILILTIREDPV